MPFPTYNAIEWPLLRAIAERGGVAEPMELYDLLADQFHLTPAERDQLIPNTKKLKWHNMVQWARNNLIKSGDLDKSERGVWKVTAEGRARVQLGHEHRTQSREPADEHGSPWSANELRAIIQDYFTMLRAEARGEVYNKAEHRRNLLGKLEGRNEQSVEFKHCNISAVLAERDLPYIDGYKPRASYQRALADAVDEFLVQHPAFWDELVDPTPPAPVVPEPPALPYQEPPFEAIETVIRQIGLRIPARTLRRYHHALKSRGFVILSGVSGTGKSWLARAYAGAVRGEHCFVAVAPNWATNEDLLGYFNPLIGAEGAYHDTDFSRFLRRAAQEYERAAAAGVMARPFHLILDEMNLARVEYYFAKFLSAMEERGHASQPELELGPNDRVLLPPNLRFIGTVNVDETTHGFADKVLDRAQVIELAVSREELFDYIGDVPYREVLMDVWDAVRSVAPFAFRMASEIQTYIEAAQATGVTWQEALDEQLLQKVLPKLPGADPRLGDALSNLVALSAVAYPLTHAKAARMSEDFGTHGSASYF